MSRDGSVKTEYDTSEYRAAGRPEPDGADVGRWRFALRTDPAPEEIIEHEGTFNEAVRATNIELEAQHRTRSGIVARYYSGRAEWIYVWLLP